MIPKYFDAVQAILKCDMSGPEDGPVSQFHLPEDVTPPTEEAIQAKLTELQTEYEANEYQRDRAVAYPSYADQLDTIYHQGLDAWKAEIKAIKDAHPKPSE